MDFTYGDFLGMEVVRDDEGVASVIVDYDEENRPVRLIGFFVDAEKLDIEIREEAWDYYQELFGLIKLM